MKTACIVVLFCLFGVLSPVSAFAGERSIDVNHATAAELAALTGVGRVRAQAIVDYRREHPPFRRPEDLLKVRGIGRFVLEHNRDRLRFEVEADSPAGRDGTKTD